VTFPTAAETNEKLIFGRNDFKDPQRGHPQNVTTLITRTHTQPHENTNEEIHQSTLNEVYTTHTKRYERGLERWKWKGNPESIIKEFLTMMTKHHWRPTTAAQYFAAITTMYARRTGGHIPDQMRHIRKWLTQRGTAQMPRAKQEVTLAEIRTLWRIAKIAARSRAVQKEHACRAIVFAWTYGQRISDVLLIRRNWITTEHFAPTHNSEWSGSYHVITHLKGKVIQYIGPYTTHVHSTHALGIWMTKELQEVTAGRTPLFRTTAADISDSLRLIGCTDKRAIRRGGLQHLARTGVPLEQIRRLFSRHKSEKSLLGYLRHGAVSQADAEAQAAITARTRLSTITFEH
jgi:hypothetical protein